MDSLSSFQTISHPFVAAIYDRISEREERKVLAPERRKLVGQARGKVLELAAGTGRNFPYYTQQVSELTALEPDPHMRQRAERKARNLPFPVFWSDALAERLPFEEKQFDHVIVTLAFCSFADPAAAAREIRRVLKPDGRLLFIEHVRASSRARTTLQDLVVPLWKRVAAGCHPNRDTCARLRREGFGLQRQTQFNQGMLWIGPFVSGEAAPL
jgi:ubiquinone/menaquinone biosynthesis C-methylase UbiE